LNAYIHVVSTWALSNTCSDAPSESFHLRLLTFAVQSCQHWQCLMRIGYGLRSGYQLACLLPLICVSHLAAAEGQIGD
jgi:hypothetical protein